MSALNCWIVVTVIVTSVSVYLNYTSGLQRPIKNDTQARLRSWYTFKKKKNNKCVDRYYMCMMQCYNRIKTFDSEVCHKKKFSNVAIVKP